MKTPTKHQAEVYTILANILMKMVYGFVALVAFIFVLIKLLKMQDPTWDSAGPYVALESLLGISVAVAFRHYFPSQKKVD